jgi:hypothetical protein
LAEILNKRKTLLPVVARKYSIDKATLRYFQPIYADSTTNLLALENTSSPQLVIGLTRNVEQLNALEWWIEERQSLLNICVLQNQNTEHLTKIISEVVALERIEQENQALNNDPVAQREFKNRLSYVKSEEARLLHDFLDHPENYRWFHNGYLLEINNRRALQSALSQAFDAIYPDTPIIKNELINRDKPSAQATGARNRLVSLLLTKSDAEDLGIEASKFPPEKAIYRALFKETGIHRFKNNEWQFQAPSADKDPYNFYPVWQKISEIIQAKNRCLVSDIYQQLGQPPFGVKAGVLPLLFVAYYLVNHRRLAMYESDVFCPTMQQEHFEILIKRPELFSVEAFAMRGIQVELFNQYFEKFTNKIADESTLLDVMKPLAKFIASLNAYTLHKKDFPPQTLAVLNAFHKTQRPTELLFTLLPQACGFEPFTQEEFESQPPKAFLDVLVEHFKVLQQAYPALLVEFKTAICDALELSPSLTTASVREAVKRFSGLEKYTKDETGLKAFILRLQSTTTDEAWLESLGALLGKASPSKWKDENRIMAFQQLELLSKRLLELKDLNEQVVKQGNENAVMVRWISQSQGENSKVVFLDAQTQETANQLLIEMNQKLAGVDSNTKLAMISKLLEQL